MKSQQKFIGRENELKILTERYNSKKPEFGVIYGNRRVGKTTLLKQFSKNKQAVYFLCEKNNFNVPRLKEEFEKIVKNPLFHKIKPKNFFDLFDSLVQSIDKKEKLILILDEFPYLIEQNKSILSEFQRIWDELLIHHNIMLIINGSSFSSMVDEVLGQKSPLYGRKTFSMKIEGLHYKDLYTLSKCKKEDLFKYYAVLGDTTLYWTFIDNTLNFFENIENIILKKGGSLYDELEFTLMQSFRETKNYSLLLEAISLGKNSFNEIVNFTQIDKSAIFRYLEILKKFNYIEGNKSVFSKKNAKNTRFILKNNFFVFHYTFIKKYAYLLERDNSNEVIKIIKKNFNIYFSHFFEKLCKEYTFEKFNLEIIGTYWHKEEEIDLIGIKEQTLFLGEVKWNNNIQGLKEKLNAFKIPEKYTLYNKKIIIFSKNKLDNTISFQDVIKHFI